MNGEHPKSDAVTSNPKDIPIRRTVLDGIKARHAAVEAAQDPIATAKDMAYLSHLDRRDLLDEIERLTRERDVWQSKAVHRGKSGSRLRAALSHVKGRAQIRDSATLLDITRLVDETLSGEPASGHETGEKRAYYETHDPPHCPTCGCGLPRADTCSCGRVELKDGYVRATCADGSVHTKGGCNSPSKAGEKP